jgi:membrane-bound ClpP family serine protease
MLWILTLAGLVAFVVGSVMLFFSEAIAERVSQGRGALVIQMETFGGAMLIFSIGMLIVSM